MAGNTYTDPNRTWKDDKADMQAEDDRAVEDIMRAFQEAQRTPIPDASPEEALRMRCLEMVLERIDGRLSQEGWENVIRTARKLESLVRRGI